jgi:hypothetical protein
MKTVEATSIVINSGQSKLSEYLERLKRKLGMGYELTVKWLPERRIEVCGEVNGGCIYIYEVNEEKALETLKHEFLDYLVSKSAEPYEKVANLLIKMVNDEAYTRKEKLVEVLTKLV